MGDFKPRILEIKGLSEKYSVIGQKDLAKERSRNERLRRRQEKISRKQPHDQMQA